MWRDDGGPPTRDDIAAAYRLLLGREPESDAVMSHHLAAPDRWHLVRNLVSSPEFLARFPDIGADTLSGPSHAATLHSAGSADAQLSRALSELAPAELPSAGIDHWTDALGVRTACRFRTGWESRRGRHVPEPEGDMLEWLGVLDAVRAARQRLCMVELGAGHGPWLARAGVAWLRRNPEQPFRLVGVEAEPIHFQFMEEHLADNGLSGSSTHLIEAAVAERDGHVDFETAPTPARDWGTRAVGVSPTHGLPRVIGAGTRRVAALSLATIAENLGTIDLLHVDIQGDEARVLAAGAEVVRRQVERLVIGTHGRDIEAELIQLLPPLGFMLVAERPCSYELGGNVPTLVTDGTQYWIRADRLPT